MFVNLTDVLTIDDKQIRIQVESELKSIEFCGETYKILEHKPYELLITNVGKGKALIEGKTDLLLDMHCDRCLKPVEKIIEISFYRDVYAPDVIEMMSDEDDDQTFMDGYQLDLEDLLYNEIVINWPMKILCAKDCKGICKQCGKDLNTGTCECDTFVPDPRMAVIKDIFNANKEV